MKIGFIGLGVMGRPMAGHLIEAGHEVLLYRVKEISKGLVERGGISCGSAREVAQAAEFVVLMLPDTPDVEEVIFGANGIADDLRPGQIVIDMSSISPVETKRFAKLLRDRGVGYVDAPVSGGENGAKAAKLTIMAGGTEEDFERAKPIFDLLGSNITRVGDVGDGQTAKVANQIIVGLTIQAVAEAFTFAAKAGADPAKVRSAISGGFASSKILEEHGRRMIERNFEPGFRIRLHRKDLSIALEAARSLDLFLPNTANVQQMMNAAVAVGLGDQDHAGLFNALEHMTTAAGASSVGPDKQ